MFIPIFIAILLGLVNPSNTNSSCHNGNGTVVVQDAPGDPGDPGDPDDPGTDGPGSGGPGGNTGNPPPKP